MVVRCLEVVVSLGGIGVVLSQVPGVPDDFKDWPVAPIMGVVTLAAISALVYVIKLSQTAMNKHSSALERLASAQNEINSNMRENNAKQSQVISLLQLNASKLDLRPCMSEDLLAVMKRIQEEEKKNEG